MFVIFLHYKERQKEKVKRVFMKNNYKINLSSFFSFSQNTQLSILLKIRNTSKKMFSYLHFVIFFLFLLFFPKLPAITMDLDDNDREEIQLTLSPSTKTKNKEYKRTIFLSDELLTESSSLLQKSEKLLIPFLEWIDNQILEEPKETKISKFLGITGLGIGLCAAYGSFPLGGDFGVLIVKFLGSQNAQFQKAIYILFGVNAAIPSMALNSVATRHQFKRLAEKPVREDELSSNNKKKIKVLNFLAHSLGFFAAISSGYVGYLVSKDFPLPIQVLITASTYIGCYMFTVESQKRVSKLMVNLSSYSKASALKRENLKKRLIQAMKSISSMDQEKFNKIYNEFFNNLQDGLGDKHSNTLNKIKDLLNLGSEEPELQTASKYTSFGEKIVTVVGALIGTAETYLAFSLVNDVTPFLCDTVGISDPVSKNVISKTFATLASIPWGCLDIEGVCGRFSRIYHSFFYKDRQYTKEFVSPGVKKGIGCFSVWGGISSALPPTYLAIQVTKGLPMAIRIVVSGATFLCPASILTQAVEEMLDQGWTWIKSFRSDSIEKHKEKLVKAIEKIYFKINELSDETINSMHRHFH